jgi:hypothetical protein
VKIKQEDPGHEKWLIQTINEWGDEIPGIQVADIRLMGLRCYQKEQEKFWMPELLVLMT